MRLINKICLVILFFCFICFSLNFDVYGYSDVSRGDYSQYIAFPEQCKMNKKVYYYPKSKEIVYVDNSTHYELYTIYILEKDGLDPLRDVSYQIRAVYYPDKKLPIVYSMSEIHTLTLESSRESGMHIEGESINNKDDINLIYSIIRENKKGNIIFEQNLPPFYQHLQRRDI